MSTFLGKILRGAATSLQSPIKAITGKSIFNESYTGDTSSLPTEKAVSWFVDTVLGGGLKPTATESTPSVTDQISGAITNLFGGVAEKAGTAAGTAAGGTLSKQAPSWLWPIIIVGALILVFGILLVKKRRR